MKSEEKKQKKDLEKKASAQGKALQPAESKETARSKSGEAKGEAKAKQTGSSRALMIAAGVIVIAVVVVAILFTVGQAGNGSTAKFSTFKNNFNSANKVSIVVYYHNASTYGQETICSTYLVEVLAARRNPATINYFTIDNNTCTYIPNGIGHEANVITNSSSSCISQAAGEPTISLAYGDSNSTVITSESLNITGNTEYFKACPIAVDIS